MVVTLTLRSCDEFAVESSRHHSLVRELVASLASHAIAGTAGDDHADAAATATAEMAPGFRPKKRRLLPAAFGGASSSTGGSSSSSSSSISRSGGASSFELGRFALRDYERIVGALGAAPTHWRLTINQVHMHTCTHAHMRTCTHAHMHLMPTGD